MFFAAALTSPDDVSKVSRTMRPILIKEDGCKRNLGYLEALPFYLAFFIILAEAKEYGISALQLSRILKRKTAIIRNGSMIWL